MLEQKRSAWRRPAASSGDGVVVVIHDNFRSINSAILHMDEESLEGKLLAIRTADAARDIVLCPMMYVMLNISWVRSNCEALIPLCPAADRITLKALSCQDDVM